MNNCSETAICTNTLGSFLCICDEGYDGDGTTCEGKHVIATRIRNYCVHIIMSIAGVTYSFHASM